MADYALLDQLGVGKEFNFRYEIGKYHGCGLSDQELEEEGSDIVLTAYLEWDRDKYSGADFYNYCRKQLKGLLRCAEKRGRTISLSALDEKLQGEVLVDVRSITETESLRNLMDSRFMERIDEIFENALSGAKDSRYLAIARKRFIEGKTLQEVADEVGLNNREHVRLCVKKISARIKEYICSNRARIYSYFDERLADVIIDFAKA